MSYIPCKNKNVLLLSTIHLEEDSIDEATGKPEIILDYNKIKGGVDVLDKLCAAYDCARAPSRRHMVIFYSSLNVSAINS